MARRVYIEVPSAQIHIDEIADDIRAWLADEVASDARRYAPVDTGYLHTHIHPNATNTRVIASGAGIPPDADAPAYVEFGTRPHDIHNAFGWGITVRHPGTQAQPYLRPAAYTRRRVPPSIILRRHNLAPR